MAEVEKRIRDKESQVSSELAKAKKVNDDFEAKTNEYTSKVELLDKKHQEDRKNAQKSSRTIRSNFWFICRRC